MGTVNRFEDLVAWQKARELTKQIYKVTNSDPFRKDFSLKDQIRRASVSAMSNIAEGFDRSGKAEFHQFLVIAKGSCAEVRSQMYVALDAELLPSISVNKIISLAEETSRVISGLRKSLNYKK